MEQISNIKKLLRSAGEPGVRPAAETIYDDLDLQKLLKISRRTSLEYRQKGYLRYYKLDGKIYYFLNEIFEDIKKKAA